MKNRTFNIVVAIVIVISALYIGLQPIREANADIGNRYKVFIRLDALYIDRNEIDSYYELDLYVNNEFKLTEPTGKLDAPVYYDLESIEQSSDFSHPTTGGVNHIESFTEKTLDIRLNLRNKGFFNDLNLDWGDISLSYNDLSTDLSIIGWHTADTGYFAVYLYISIIDDFTPYIHSISMSQSISQTSDSEKITINATIEDFSVIDSVYTKYSTDFGSTWHYSFMSNISTSEDSRIYQTEIGSFAYGTPLYYNIEANDSIGNIYTGLDGDSEGYFYYGGIGIPLDEAEQIIDANSYQGTMVHGQYDHYNFTLLQESAVNISLICPYTEAFLKLRLYDENGNHIQGDYYDDIRFGTKEIFTVPPLIAGKYFISVYMDNDVGDFKSSYNFTFNIISGSFAPTISNIQYSSPVYSSDEDLTINFTVRDDIFVDNVQFLYSLDNENEWIDINTINGFYQSDYLFDPISGSTPQFREFYFTKDEILHINCSWNTGADSDSMDFSLHRPGTTIDNASIYNSLGGSCLTSAGASPELGVIKILESGNHLFKISNFVGIIPQTGSISILSSKLSVTILGNPFPQDSIPLKIKIRATDNGGNVNELITDIPVEDDIIPSIDILSLEDQGEYTNETLNLAYSTSDDNVELYLNGFSQGIITNNTLITVTEGETNVTITATDIGGLITSCTVIIYVDTTFPAVSISNPINNSVIGSNSISIVYTATDTNIIQANLDNYVIMYLNDVSIGYKESGYILSSLSQGFYNLTVIVTDSFGNSIIKFIFFTIDTDAPYVEILSPLTRSYTESQTLIQYNYEADCELEILINGEDYSSIDNNTFISLPDGDYNLTISATDDAENIGVSTVLFSIDTVIPFVDIITPLNTYYADNQVLLSWQKEPGSTLTVYLDNVESIAFNNSVFNLDDGQHNITLIASDEAGNTNSDTVIFTIDTTNPVLTITSPENSNYNSDSIMITYLTNEQLYDVIAYFDNEIITIFENNSYLIFNIENVEGSHNLTIIGFDLAGNSDVTSVFFNVDTIAPYIEIINPINNYYNTQNLEVSYLSENDVQITCYMNGVLYPAYSNNSVIHFNEGMNNITIVAEDTFGNINSLSTIFTVDITTPTINIISPLETDYESNSISVIFNSNENLLNSVIYLDGVEQSEILNGSILTNLSEGNHNITIVVVDLAGNTGKNTVIFNVSSTGTDTMSVSDTESSETNKKSPGFELLTLILSSLILQFYFNKKKKHD